MNLQSDEVAEKILRIAKKIDHSAYSIPWNGKKQRHVARLYYDNNKDPGTKYRAVITCAKDKIYWWIGVNTAMYDRYKTIIDKHADLAWNLSHPDENRIIFYSIEEFESFAEDCFGGVGDINVPLRCNEMTKDGRIVICPNCRMRFKRAQRCPECGQLILYNV